MRDGPSPRRRAITLWSALLNSSLNSCLSKFLFVEIPEGDGAGRTGPLPAPHDRCRQGLAG
jgi:hypothetical protein